MIHSALLLCLLGSTAALAQEPPPEPPARTELAQQQADKKAPAAVEPPAGEKPADEKSPADEKPPADEQPPAGGRSPADDEARAGEQPPAVVKPPPEDKSIDQHRSALDALTERMIGTASKSIRFDWRKSSANFGVVVSELLERNNFGSTRLGLMARKPFGSAMAEVAVTRVFTWTTDSSDKLALTPYRQHGRPSRFELDVNVGLPLAEGVVTSLPGWVPPAELVFSADAGLRYLFYPGALGGKTFLKTAEAVVSPRLTTSELQKMEADRPGGMLIDPARYGLLAGLSLDVYFQPGVFVTPRAMIAVPILAPATGSGLGLWWELSLGLGWAL